MVRMEEKEGPLFVRRSSSHHIRRTVGPMGWVTELEFPPGSQAFRSPDTEIAKLRLDETSPFPRVFLRSGAELDLKRSRAILEGTSATPGRHHAYQPVPVPRPAFSSLPGRLERGNPLLDERNAAARLLGVEAGLGAAIYKSQGISRHQRIRGDSVMTAEFDLTTGDLRTMRLEVAGRRKAEVGVTHWSLGGGLHVRESLTVWRELKAGHEQTISTTFANIRVTN